MADESTPATPFDTDRPTGLLSRAAFLRRLDARTSEPGAQFALLLAQPGATFGVRAKDERVLEQGLSHVYRVDEAMLAKLGKRLGEQLAGLGQLGRVGEVGRVRGGEFALMTGDGADWRVAAERMVTATTGVTRHTFGEWAKVNDAGEWPTVNARIGIARFPQDAQSADELIACAERAVSDARRARCGLAVYSPESASVRTALGDWRPFRLGTDALTGLPSREALQYLLAVGWSRLATTPVSVLHIDIDNMHALNDQRGHHFGERLLAAVGLRLRFHADDIGVASRIAGDAFMVLAESDWRAAVERVRTVLGEPFAIDGETVTITAGIGVVRCPQDCADVENLFAYSEDAMYVAKRDRGGCALYEPPAPGS